MSASGWVDLKAHNGAWLIVVCDAHGGRANYGRPEKLYRDALAVAQMIAGPAGIPIHKPLEDQ
jgi:hypothetical protein